MSITMLMIDDHHRDDEHDRLDEEEVLVLDRGLGHEAEAGPVEDRLDDDGVAGEGADDLPAEQRDVRDAGVAQGVHAQDATLGHALRLGDLDVLGVELVDHRRAHDDRQAPDRRQGEADRREDQVVRPRPGPDLEPVQLHREGDQQHEAEEELRHRQARSGSAW